VVAGYDAALPVLYQRPVAAPPGAKVCVNPLYHRYLPDVTAALGPGAPCRRAASATMTSPANTASTTRTLPSIGNLGNRVLDAALQLDDAGLRRRIQLLRDTLAPREENPP
jgi:hypothetical protein